MIRGNELISSDLEFASGCFDWRLNFRVQIRGAHQHEKKIRVSCRAIDQGVHIEPTPDLDRFSSRPRAKQRRSQASQADQQVHFHNPSIVIIAQRAFINSLA